MESCDAALDRLCDPVAEVSAHYLISEVGSVLALVPEAARAWHAGAGAWGGITDVNSHSIGIELANTGAQPFPHPQMTALERLLAQVMDRWRISPDRVIAHSDMAPDRKGDPGARFDWRRLALAGLAVWPQGRGGDDGPADVAAFCAAVRAFGYPAGAAPDHLLAAFRLRFRPWAQGPLDAEDLRCATDLARRFPAEGPGAGAHAGH
jgi:N-acetylmuramoyl-L-alanine amidase